MAISPQLPEHSAKLAKRYKLTYDVLGDAGNAWALQMGLAFEFPEDIRDIYQNTLRLDLPRFNGDDSWELPMPGRFLVASDGTIVHQDVDPDYTRRPEPVETLDKLRQLFD